MDRSDDSFDQHRKLIEILMAPEGWRRALYDLSEIIFYLSAIREGYMGIVNNEQKHLLNVVNHHAEYLNESLDIFTMASHLLFSSKQVESQEINLLDALVQLEKEWNKEKYPDLQVEKAIVNDPVFIPGDVFLIHEAFKNLARLIKQIHPNHEGNLSIKIYREEDLAKVLINRDKEDFASENGLSVFPFDVNPEWFIVHSIAKLHGGTFSIDDSSRNNCVFYLALPLQQPNN